jgi:hypothetical protein
MTIALAGYVTGYLIAVCDARLSYGEAIAAADDATMKNRRIAQKWGVMFAATNATTFIPVVNYLREKLSYTEFVENNFTPEEIEEHLRVAYEREFNERFFRAHLARFGFHDVADFRRNGFAEMGKDLYGEYADSLARFDLGLELLAYGFGPQGQPYLLEVMNPGVVECHNLRRFAAIGSGSLMALASLNRKPIPDDFASCLYRLLDAKFSSETARDVGKKSFVITMRGDGTYSAMAQAEIEAVREIWEQELMRPNPSDAMDIIKNSKAVTSLTAPRSSAAQSS